MNKFVTEAQPNDEVEYLEHNRFDEAHELNNQDDFDSSIDTDASTAQISRSRHSSASSSSGCDSPPSVSMSGGHSFAHALDMSSSSGSESSGLTARLGLDDSIVHTAAGAAQEGVVDPQLNAAAAASARLDAALECAVTTAKTPAEMEAELTADFEREHELEAEREGELERGNEGRTGGVDVDEGKHPSPPPQIAAQRSGHRLHGGKMATAGPLQMQAQRGIAEGGSDVAPPTASRARNHENVAAVDTSIGGVSTKGPTQVYTGDEGSSNGNVIQEQPVKPEHGAYDPLEYEHIATAHPDLRDFFKYIGLYKPRTPEAEYVLRPFIPEYSPSIGQPDSFLKPAQPATLPIAGSDTRRCRIPAWGLEVLDEPASEQSDSAVVGLQLSAMSKHKRQHHEGRARHVPSISYPERKPDQIAAWVRKVAEVRRGQTAPTVRYRRAMPEPETLMRSMPPSMEVLLQSLASNSRGKIEGTGLPDISVMELSLAEEAQVVCNMLDIPVRPGHRVEALHMLFTLFADFRQNEHFAQCVRANRHLQSDPSDWR